MKGLDATVDQVYDRNGKLIYTVDLKFKNTSRYPLLIEAKADGTRLTFNIYSTKPDWTITVAPPQIEDVVKADATIVRELDSSLAPGEQIWVEAAQDGFKSTIVRTVSERGKEPTVFNLVTTYQPSRNVVLAGPSSSN
jgi:vancomycin resistance protein YoaR